MQLLYSGAVAHNAKQNNPNESLGGYVSSTPIPNGGLNNIFPSISRESIKNNEAHTRLIVFKTTQALTGVRVWVEKGLYSNYTVACIAAAIVDNNPVFESIEESNSIPYQSTLVEATEVSPITLGSIAANLHVGIWIRKELDSSAFSILDAPISNDVTDEQLEAALIAEGGELFDEGKLIIDWN